MQFYICILLGHYLDREKKKHAEKGGEDIDPTFEQRTVLAFKGCILEKNQDCVPQVGMDLATPIVRETRCHVSWTSFLPTEFFFQSFFCGSSKECRKFKSIWAGHQARNHVELWYPVVAVYERLDESLKVLEAKLPKFFQGLTEVYKSMKTGEQIV